MSSLFSSLGYGIILHVQSFVHRQSSQFVLTLSSVSFSGPPLSWLLRDEELQIVRKSFQRSVLLLELLKYCFHFLEAFGLLSLTKSWIHLPFLSFLAFSIFPHLAGFAVGFATLLRPSGTTSIIYNWTLPKLQSTQTHSYSFPLFHYIYTQTLKSFDFQWIPKETIAP